MAVRRPLAGRAPTPVFVAAGGGARGAVDELLTDPAVRAVRSPRAASVLVVVGRLPRPLLRPAALVHDQLPHPRATVWWTGGDRGELAGAFGEEVVTGDLHEVVATIRRVHADLLGGERSSDAAILPAVPPRRWRGVGPHGQGGMGMMGGAPYGRPMAMTGPDRDGLQLDQVPVTLGPFLAGWPPGLALDLVLQGDVVREVSVRPNPFAAADPFARPAGGGVADDRGATTLLHPLRRTATVLDHHGLSALAARARSLSIDPAGMREIPPLVRRLRRSRTLRWAMSGVGPITHDQLAQLAPGDRGGLAGDAWDRFRRRLDEVEPATSDAPGQLDPGAGRRTAALLALLPDLLTGAELGDAATTVVSLDLDLESAARHEVAA